MVRISHKKIVPFTAAQMYKLVNQVDQYAEFLPWCTASEILACSDELMTAKLTIKKGHFSQAFVTKNTLVPNQSIVMHLEQGHFQHLEGRWVFVPLADGTCEVCFELDFHLKSKLLSLVLDPIFHGIANTMIDAFLTRAKELYSEH